MALSMPVAANETVTEAEYVEAAPEPGDEYFEAEASDGRWISYVNPRDEYRSPYLGDGSGKICVLLLNEAGKPIVGETIPNTTVSIPTGETLDWHSSADPVRVQYPLTEQYDRPLDADQFGTTDDLPQGDGYMDSHCIEFHGLSVTDQISYGHAEITGAHENRVDVVGYIQQANDTWESDTDPLNAATPYEDAGGWTYSESSSHGQVTVVLQLSPEESQTAASAEDPQTESTTPQRGDRRIAGIGVIFGVVTLSIVLLRRI